MNSSFVNCSLIRLICCLIVLLCYLPMIAQDYRIVEVDGQRKVVLYDRCLGEEQTIQVEFLRSIPKRSLHYYKALSDGDTVTVLNLNPKVGELFKVADTSTIKVRPIKSLRMLYWELPSAPVAYCFEKDTVWFSQDDTSPKYVLMDENVMIEHAKKRKMDDDVETWEYKDSTVIKTLKITGPQNEDVPSFDQNNDQSLYDNLTFENGVCYKQFNVVFDGFGKNPLNGSFSEGLSQVLSKENDIPTSSISFIYDNQEYYISLSNDCDWSGEDYRRGDMITVQIAFFENVKQPYDNIYPFAIVMQIRGVKTVDTD